MSLKSLRVSVAIQLTTLTKMQAKSDLQLDVHAPVKQLLMWLMVGEACRG